MKKFFTIFMILLFLFLIKASYAVEIKLQNYYKRAENKDNYVQAATFKWTYYYSNLEFKEMLTDKGNLLDTKVNLHYDMTSHFDIWYGVRYTSDERYNIKSRLGYKIGAGYYFIKEIGDHETKKLKGSYGVVLRKKKYFHSLRVKNSWDMYALKNSKSMLNFGYNFIITYLTPMNGFNGREFDATMELFIELMSIRPSLTVEYQHIENKPEFIYILLGSSFKIGE